jgi:hypothetical protein
VLSFDKVLQLARFATPESETKLVTWARRASVNAIRNRADVAEQPPLEETRAAHRDRYLWMSWYRNAPVELHAVLPAQEGAAVIAAIEGLAATLPRAGRGAS